MNKNQKGNAVILVLVLLLVIFIAATGYLVYKNNKDKNPTVSKSNAAMSTNTTPIVAPNIPDSYATFSANAEGLKIAYPNTWTFSDPLAMCNSGNGYRFVASPTDLAKGNLKSSDGNTPAKFEVGINSNVVVKKSAKCDNSTSGNDMTGYTAAATSNKITTGVLTGKWVTTVQSETSGYTKGDYVTNNKYEGGSKITEPAVITIDGHDYQFNSFVSGGQYIMDVETSGYTVSNLSGDAYNMFSYITKL